MSLTSNNPVFTSCKYNLNPCIFNFILFLRSRAQIFTPHQHYVSMIQEINDLTIIFVNNSKALSYDVNSFVEHFTAITFPKL